MKKITQTPYKFISPIILALILSGCISAKSTPVEVAEEAEPAPTPPPVEVVEVVEEIDGDDDNDGVPNSIDKCPDTAPGVKVDAQGCEIIFTIKGANFDHDESTLKPDASESLDRAYAIIRENPNTVYEIAGHTDFDGTDEYNIDLGYRRAVSVMNYLTNKGISLNQLRPESYGENQPIATNETEAGKALNRRVEIVRLVE